MNRIQFISGLFKFLCFSCTGGMVMSNGRYLYQTDRFANERFLYSKARLYADGSIIIDDKCDGVIYTRIGNEYFKWDYEGVINMQ